MSCYWHKDSTKNSMMHRQHKASARLGINRRFFLTVLIVLIVIGLILAFAWFFKRSTTAVHRTEAEPQTEKLDAPEQLNNPRGKIRSRSKQETQALSKKGDNKGSDGLDDYYKVIVTNNLFRPLGWTEKKSGPSYRLIGTVIKDDGNSKALILDENTKQTYYVAVGDKIGNATVEKIASKKVALRQQNGGLLEPELGPLAFMNVPHETSPQEQAAERPHRPGEAYIHRIGSATIVSGAPISREKAESLAKPQTFQFQEVLRKIESGEIKAVIRRDF